jgi:hypothetical protein
MAGEIKNHLLIEIRIAIECVMMKEVLKLVIVDRIYFKELKFKLARAVSRPTGSICVLF